MWLDWLVTTEAKTVSAFGDPGQCVVDASGFVDVPVGQTVEQLSSAFIRRTIDPLFVFVHRDLLPDSAPQTGPYDWARARPI